MINSSALKGILGVTLLVIAGVFAWQEIKAQGVDLMPVRYVRVEGAFQYIAKDKIKQVLNKQVMQGFYNVDLTEVKGAVEALPWAADVAVDRVWPDAIKIRITEQQPMVRWGEKSLLNGQGELFVPDNIAEFDSLPLINGPDGQENRLLEVMKGLALTLQDQAMALRVFDVNERRAWKVVLASGLEIKLGRQKPLENIQRFLRTVELLGEERLAMMAEVDLRYPNGYAVTWKADAEEIDWKKIVDKKAEAGIEHRNG